MQLRELYLSEKLRINREERNLYNASTGLLLGELNEFEQKSTLHRLLYGINESRGATELDILSSSINTVSEKLYVGDDTVPMLSQWKLREIELYQRMYQSIVDQEIHTLYEKGHSILSTRELYVLSVEATMVTDTERGYSGNSYVLQVLLGGSYTGSNEITYYYIELSGTLHSLILPLTNLDITTVLDRHNYRKSSLLNDSIYSLHITDSKVSDYLREEYNKVRGEVMLREGQTQTTALQNVANSYTGEDQLQTNINDIWGESEGWLEDIL